MSAVFAILAFSALLTTAIVAWHLVSWRRERLAHRERIARAKRLVDVVDRFQERRRYD